MYRTSNTTADEAIREAHAAIAQRARLAAIAKALQPDLNAAEHQVTELAKKLDAERRDVERYTGGVWAFLYGIFADREERLSKEQIEAMQAQARYQEAVTTRDRLAEEMASLNARIDGLKNAERQLAAARTAKQQLLVRSGDPAGKQLELIELQLGSYDAELTSIEEALVAGRRAQETLFSLSKVLQSASNWGVADILTDSFLVSWGKREKLDEARSHAGAAQAALIVFQRELGDLGIQLEGDVAELADHHRFLDTWFDNIFSDFSVQSRIDSARTTTKLAVDQVESRLLKLSKRGRELEDKRKDLMDQRGELLD
ncbi:MAG: hypothetical protein AB7O24_09550 [Kofleriaceae bacterium]